MGGQQSCRKLRRLVGRKNHNFGWFCDVEMISLQHFKHSFWTRKRTRKCCHVQVTGQAFNIGTTNDVSFPKQRGVNGGEY